jgi:transcriptional regulator with XRE-family HTH domain
VRSSVEQLGEVGRYIREQRHQAELSLRKLASQAGVSNPYLSQIERGLREPSEKVVDAIAKSLQMTADTLYEQAGIVAAEEPEDAGVRAAIEADEQLTGRQRRALLEIYDAFLAVNGAPRHRRRRTVAPDVVELVDDDDDDAAVDAG